MKLGYAMKPDDFLMFSGNKWGLYKIDCNGYESWVYHACNPMATRFTVSRFLSVTEMRRDPIKCWNCQQEVPENIATLWKLHNFDAIGVDDQGIREALKAYDIQDGDL